MFQNSLRNSYYQSSDKDYTPDFTVILWKKNSNSCFFIAADSAFQDFRLTRHSVGK